MHVCHRLQYIYNYIYICIHSCNPGRPAESAKVVHYIKKINHSTMVRDDKHSAKIVTNLVLANVVIQFCVV